jgi:hypothetical protein
MGDRITAGPKMELTKFGFLGPEEFLRMKAREY